MGRGGEFRVFLLTSHCYGSLVNTEITLVVIVQLFPCIVPSIFSSSSYKRYHMFNGIPVFSYLNWTR